MDKIDKALLKLPNKQRQKLMQAFGQVMEGKVEGLNIKKLKGHSDVYRLRVGDSRLVFRQLDSGEQLVLHVGKRNEQTYRDF